ncbi:hypothetical protein Plec18170_004409 [Paecilomyces lecythidis]
MLQFETLTKVSAPVGLVVVILLPFLWNYLRSPLKLYPGPFASKFTDLWRALDVFNGRCDITHNELHRKHGIAVRMGPNVLSISDPNEVSRVFTVKKAWKKSAMYSVNDSMDPMGNRLSNLFGTRDENYHSMLIRPVRNLYTMTKAQEMEPLIDETIVLFCDKLMERFAVTGKACEMTDYILYWSWDTMNNLVFSKTMGILEAGNDSDGFLKRSQGSLDYFATISQIPYMDEVLAKNPIRPIGPPTFDWAVIYSLGELAKRREKPVEGKVDFLERFLEIQKKDPKQIDDIRVVTYLLTNVLAGSDSTAITITAALYYILKNPNIQSKLCKELQDASLSIPASWESVRNLPYLNAVMREAMRIHPGVGLMLERTVPEGGFTLSDGRFVPEGTVIGMNPWVINRSESVFGSEPDRFIPERWLAAPGEPEEEFKKRLGRMNGCDLTFGSGKRVCVGQYLSKLEAYKMVATLFTKFHIELADPKSDWRVINSWFVRQENVPVLLRERSAL